MGNLISILKSGIFRIEDFSKSKSGNIYDYICTDFKKFSTHIKDITAGGNGGMGSIGKGEWLISILAGIDPTTDKPRASILKNGCGDLLYNNKSIEVKWNGAR
jgi:hypothetical protein